MWRFPRLLSRRFLADRYFVREHLPERISAKRVARNRMQISLVRLKARCKNLDETVYWAELIAEAGIFAEKRLKPLCDEAEELMAMFLTMVKKEKITQEWSDEGSVTPGWFSSLISHPSSLIMKPCFW